MELYRLSYNTAQVNKRREPQKIIKMKTLADLKRDINIGTAMTLVDAPTMPDHKFLNIKRVVHTKDTTGIYLNESVDTLKKGSFLPWPKTKRMAYNGEMLTIYDDNGNAELSYKIHA